jgi:exonuclease III
LAQSPQGFFTGPGLSEISPLIIRIIRSLCILCLNSTGTEGGLILLQKGTVDILFLAETKLDQSFVDCQFKVDNYIFWRQDRTSKGGGLAVYLRSPVEERVRKLKVAAVKQR